MRFSIVAYKTRLRVIRKNRQYFVIGMYYVYSVIKMFDWEDLSKNILCIAMKLAIFTLHQNEIFKLLKSNLSELHFFTLVFPSMRFLNLYIHEYLKSSSKKLIAGLSCWEIYMTFFCTWNIYCQSEKICLLT